MSERLLPERLSFLNPHIVDDLARYGNPRDGGYVLPQSTLSNIDAVLSFGLSTDWSLEEELAAGHPERLIHVYDHTVGARTFRRSLKGAFWKFVGAKTSLADLRTRYATDVGYRRFFTGHRVHFRERVFNRQDHTSDATLAIAFARLGAARHVLVKIDIEGGEYRIIPELTRFADRIDVIAIEFHDTDPLRPVFEAQIRALLDDFAIIHVHGNNIAGIAADGLPDALEITFLSRRFGIPERRRDRLPVAGLDRPNDPLRPDVALRFR
ncbi:MAG TPA: hypothetical protein VGP48_02590 [Stellaceae bacterium]|nr:hypothetical protein [Stellaceae bacterium]